MGLSKCRKAMGNGENYGKKKILGEENNGLRKLWGNEESDWTKKILGKRAKL